MIDQDREQQELATLRERLWAPPSQATPPPDWRNALLEQYKLYVEMTDRISQRRGVANTFFLTLNTAVFVTIGVFWEHQPDGQVFWLIVPTIALVAQCYAWFALLRSYRQLNAAKFKVIKLLEERLPAAPYVDAEWYALTNDPNNSYRPLSTIEAQIPRFFAFLYVAAYLAALFRYGGLS